MEVQSMDYLLDESAKNNLSLGQIVLREEVRETGASAESILEKLSRTWRVMKEAASAGIATDLKSVSGLTGGDAARYYNHIRNRKNLLGGMEAKAVAYALATSGYNAAMGVIAAAPTRSVHQLLLATMLMPISPTRYTYHGAPARRIFSRRMTSRYTSSSTSAMPCTKSVMPNRL